MLYKLFVFYVGWWESNVWGVVWMCFAVFQYFDNRAEAHNFLKILGARQLWYSKRLSVWVCESLTSCTALHIQIKTRKYTGVLREQRWEVRQDLQDSLLAYSWISHGRLSRVLAGQAEQGGLPKLDTRGRHEPPNKTSEEDKAFIRQHIESFPVYESHYSRSDNPYRRYLSPELSQAKIYHLYKQWEWLQTC